MPAGIVAHRDGYGFLVPDQPIPRVDGDLFIGRDNLGDAMHGDHVLARIERRRADGRAEGRVVQIVEREHPTIVGLFRYGPHGNDVLPYDTRIHHEVLIPPGEELTPDLRQKLGAPGTGEPVRDPPHAAAGTRWRRRERRNHALSEGRARARGPRDRNSRPPRRNRRRRRNHHPQASSAARFSRRSAGGSAARPRNEVAEADLPAGAISAICRSSRSTAKRRAISTTPFTSRRSPNGHFELQVHIADVAHYVRRGSPLDREARLRGTSVYFPNRAVPMLPEELSNGICSLNPQVDRLVMSVDHGNGRDREDGSVPNFTPGVIRSAERMTYTNVHKVLEGDPEMTQRYAPLVDEFRRMKELALLLNRRRDARGSIDFDLPEPVIEFDADGRMLSIVRSERNIAHRIIEEFMLAANEAVAQYLESAASLRCIASTKSPIPRRCWNSRSWRRPSAIRSASTISPSAAWPCGTDRRRQPRAIRARVARPRTHAADERDLAAPGGNRYSPAALPAADAKRSPASPRSEFFLT